VAIGNRRAVRLLPGWEESPRLSGAIVAPPGTGKTPAVSLARGGPKNALDPIAREKWARLAAGGESGGDAGRSSGMCFRSARG
jgi:hypothetical protein